MKCIIRYIRSREKWRVFEFNDVTQVVTEWVGSWNTQAKAERAIVVESMARGVKRYEWTVEK